MLYACDCTDMHILSSWAVDANTGGAAETTWVGFKGMISDSLLTVEDLLVSRSVLTVTMKKDAVIKTVGAMIAHFQMAQEPPFVPLCLHSHCLPKWP